MRAIALLVVLVTFVLGVFQRILRLLVPSKAKQVTNIALQNHSNDHVNID